ncbi:phosphotransferase [Conexibacter sp. JD483]|uniref:phosphotransferase n=1 Tax=unclassified Conexibacter TaxID=2627773 RepID=UPI0027233DA7|nr:MULTISPECIES: phosphotransferase [unclassified Conexibacter]MDO8188617.1 phosphotransferase [Conexibacter sp. CPCC 205706]MDO8201507.1 phosphotransferase [Conexibacter sp. CPCC 205762]MDR9370874.1 phosphotransferase [Conexibacter sp. JD483]
MPLPAPSFDRDELSTVVARLTGDRSAPPEPHVVAPLDGAGPGGATGGLWRVASAPGAAQPWSAVLKLVVHSDAGHRHWRSSRSPRDPMYWKHEALLYGSGLLDELSGGLRAPRCLLVAERTDEHVALWLEDVGGAVPAGDWPLARYAVAARHLGAAQAGFVSRCGELPRWLSRGWLRAYVERRAGEIATPLPPEAWRHPLVRIAMPQPLDRWVADVWRRRAMLFSLLAELPQTLCHLDVWPPNLFADRDDRTIAIDWAYAGIGALGEDVGNLVPDAVLDCFVDGGAVRELHELTVAGYLDGLSSAGWDGDPAQVRCGIAASAVLKYLWMAPALVRRAHDPEQLAGLEQQFDRSAEDLFAQRGHVLDLLQALDADATAHAATARHGVKLRAHPRRKRPRGRGRLTPPG